ncbi:MAG: TNT domain-containing protein [Minicystis sp.]
MALRFFQRLFKGVKTAPVAVKKPPKWSSGMEWQKPGPSTVDAEAGALDHSATQVGQNPHYTQPPSTPSSAPSLQYPANNGVQGSETSGVLPNGTVVDRFGGPHGTYFASPNTPFDQRSLPPQQYYAPYTQYTVIGPNGLPVQMGTTAPYFYAQGGGTQYRTTAGASELVKQGILKQNR